MSEDTATTILLAGLALGTLLWFIAIRLRLAMVRMPDLVSRTIRTKKQTTAGALATLLPPLAHAGTLSDRSDTTLTLTNRFFIARIQGRDTGEGAELEVVLDYSNRRKLRTFMTILVFLVQPLVIFGLFLLLWYLVLPSEQPGIRTQAIQIVQMVHVLWPPFLLFHLHRKLRSLAGAMVDNLALLVQGS